MNSERDNLAETLRGIASGSRRNKTARLREIFDEVEAAKAAGASNKTIVDGLKAHGLIFDVNNFKNARSRILKERALAALIQATPAANEIKPIRHPSKEASPKEKKGVKDEKTKPSLSGRPPVLLNNDRGIYGDLEPSPIDGTVDLKQQ